MYLLPWRISQWYDRGIVTIAMWLWDDEIPNDNVDQDVGDDDDVGEDNNDVS